jgi:hypothetical protein
MEGMDERLMAVLELPGRPLSVGCNSWKGWRDRRTASIVEVLTTGGVVHWAELWAKLGGRQIAIRAWLEGDDDARGLQQSFTRRRL